MRRLALAIPFVVTFALAEGAEVVPMVPEAGKIVIDADDPDRYRLSQRVIAAQ